MTAPNAPTPVASRPQADRPQTQKTPARAPRRKSPYATFVVLCACALALGVALQALLPNGFSLGAGAGGGETAPVAEIHASDTVQINEVMTSNSRLLRDVRGDTPDWVEVRNASDAPVELAGWTLSRGADESHAFVFPARTLSPGECVLIYADSAYTQADGDYHAPFSLRAAGDTLMLFNPAGVAVEAINIPALAKNTVYRRVGDVWEVSGEYTPGLANTRENHQSMFKAMTPSDVVISEVMAANVNAAAADDGMFYDYIELVNLSSQEVDISGFYLSDSASDSAAWRIPDGMVIPANGYMLFYASGRNEGMHTNFRLASEGEEAVLSNRLGQVLSVVDYDILVENQACSRRADGSYTTDLPPTPGAANE